MTSTPSDLVAYLQTLAPAEAIATSRCLLNGLADTSMRHEPARTPAQLQVLTTYTATVCSDLIVQRVATPLGITPDHQHCKGTIEFLEKVLRDLVREGIARGGDGT